MIKLKTLKDLKFANDSNDADKKALIRYEAIKWVKATNKDGGMCHTCDDLWNDFLNIPEEDLK